jgi:hypothetical protein
MPIAKYAGRKVTTGGYYPDFSLWELALPVLMILACLTQMIPKASDGTHGPIGCRPK